MLINDIGLKICLFQAISIDFLNMITIRRSKIFKNDILLFTSLILTCFAVIIIIPVFRGMLMHTDNSQRWKVILYYTTIFGARPTSIWSTTSLKGCAVPQCVISDDRRLLLDSDVVIFHGRDMPVALPTERSTNQRWVYFIQENPYYTSPEPSTYNGVFNWTMTYKRSSDIWAPYGSYRTVSNTDMRDSEHVSTTAGW